MKYVLGLSFEFKYYKNPANIKIFSNNQLIDDIDLTEDIKLKTITPDELCKNIPVYNDWYYPGWDTLDEVDPYNSFPYTKMPEKMFVYTLDETVLQNSIKIEITNNNSNYTNGFMTKWSSFTFRYIFLVPTYYLDLKNYALLMRKDNPVITNFDMPKSTDIGGFKTTNKITNNLMWPDEYRFVENGQLVFEPSDKTHCWRNWEKGGSFSFELPIIECILKKGLKMLGPINYEQLLEKEKRRLYLSDFYPLYINHLNLINTQK
jgi:hypothetical protein